MKLKGSKFFREIGQYLCTILWSMLPLDSEATYHKTFVRLINKSALFFHIDIEFFRFVFCLPQVDRFPLWTAFNFINKEITC